METIFMNNENSKISEPHRLQLNLTDKLNLKDPLSNLGIYYTWENIKFSYNNKFKISAPTWINTFDLTDGSYSISDIQDYSTLNLSLKKHETLLKIHQLQLCEQD